MRLQIEESKSLERPFEKKFRLEVVKRPHKSRARVSVALLKRGLIERALEGRHRKSLGNTPLSDIRSKRVPLFRYQKSRLWSWNWAALSNLGHTECIQTQYTFEWTALNFKKFYLQMKLI